jgi:hypothetical protein
MIERVRIQKDIRTRTRARTHTHHVNYCYRNVIFMVVCAESRGCNEFPFVRHHVVRERKGASERLMQISAFVLN